MPPPSLPIYPTVNPVGPINPQSNSVPQAMTAPANPIPAVVSPTSAAAANSIPAAAPSLPAATNPTPAATNSTPLDRTPLSDDDEDYQSTVTSPGDQNNSQRSSAGAVNNPSNVIDSQPVTVNSQSGTVNNQSGTVNSQSGTVNNQSNTANSSSGAANSLLDPAKDAAVQLLLIQTAGNARDYLKSNRLPIDQRFDGNHNVDFESTLLRFKRVTEESKVAPQEQCYELKHYFSGDAAKICELYEGEGDPKENLQKAIRHLKQEYGYHARSAQAIIDRLLTGAAIKQEDTAAFKKFRINLEGEVTKAKTSGRANSFDNADTINKIIRKKLPFVKNRWAVERGKQVMGVEPENAEPEPRFDDFLTFLRSQNFISDERELIGGPKETPKNKKDARTMKIDAIAASPTSTNGAPETTNNYRGGGGGKRGRGRGKPQGGNDSTPGNNSTSPSDNTPAASQTSVKQQQQKAAQVAAAKLETQQKQQSQTYGTGKRPSGGNDAANGQRKGANTDSSASGNNNQSAATSKQTTGNWSCPVCNRSKFHELTNCKEFLAKNQYGRFLVLKTRGLCHRCFQHGHLAKNCDSGIECDHCTGGFHHSLLHRYKRQTEQNQDSESDEASDGGDDTD